MLDQSPRRLHAHRERSVQGALRINKARDRRDVEASAHFTTLAHHQSPPQSLRPIACCLPVDDHGTMTSAGRPSCPTALPRVTFAVGHKVQTPWHDVGLTSQSTRSTDAGGGRGQSLMARSFSPEFRLAAACAMWPPSDRRTEAIRAAAAGPLDWPRFLRVAQRHRVLGLAHQGLTGARLAVPPEIRREIGAQAATLVRENLAMAAEALRLQRLFDEAHLPVLFVKGSSLAMLAFGNLGLSGGQDIDLLVPRETLPAATEFVARAGYRRFDPPPDISDAQLRQLMPLRKDLGFVHQATGLRIELHWRLFLNPHAMAEASIMAASRDVPLTGAMGLRTLGEEDLFAYLCMHGALHWWNRLKWLADINALLASTPEDSIERLIRAAEVRGAGRAAAQALLLCRRLLGTPLPAATDGHAGQERHGALAGGDSVERDDHGPRRARSARGALRDDPRQPLDLSSQPELALSAGRTEHPSDQPDRHAGHAAAGAAAIPLPASAAAALGVAACRQAPR